MTERKIVFFDIDGTIWDEKCEIPQSTVKAIQTLRKNGHLAFLCSGRCRSHIRSPKLLQIGFDGVVSGCGTMIEYNGETVYYKRLDNELVEYTVDTVRQHGFRPILEGKDYLYMDEEEFKHHYFGKMLKKEMGDRILSISGNWGKWEISKLTCATNGVDTEKGFAVLDKYYDYMIHNSDVVEMVPKGYHKGTGIRKLCEILDADILDTIAFGDSVNDLGMLHTVGLGVAMGSGAAQAKEAADYVTAPLQEDGIWKGCRHLGLI